jgi:sulfoxide reductase catalytic subunit YedY
VTLFRVPPRWRLPERRATPEAVWLQRRRLVANLGLAGAGLALGGGLLAAGCARGPSRRQITQPALEDRYAGRFPAPRDPRWELGGDRRPTPEIIAATVNNFYEFTLDKWAVWELAVPWAWRHGVSPWTVQVGGLVRRPKTLDLDDLFGRFPLEERLYRFRCVERWGMQVPWTGFPLARLIDLCEPLGAARYVRFVSLHDPATLPGQAEPTRLPWPFFEALRLDEARHPLAFAAVGIYGHALPMQHGAPWRVVVPWKYGYKSPKSIVRIELTAERPPTFWNTAQPSEFGWYSNVDPGRDHPRWTQRTETDVGTGAMRPTLPYNGYAEVAELYAGGEF